MKYSFTLIAIGCLFAGGWAAPIPTDKFHFVDLQPKANQKLTDNFGSGAEGNNLKELPTGIQTFDGIKYKIEEKHLQLGSKMVEKMPEKIEGIKVEKTCTKLHILHATCYGVIRTKRARLGSSKMIL
jgi:hypothetical protein